MKNFIFALSAALLLAGCATSNQSASVPQGKCEVKGSCMAPVSSIEGTYKAFLPCANTQSKTALSQLLMSIKRRAFIRSRERA